MHDNSHVDPCMIGTTAPPALDIPGATEGSHVFEPSNTPGGGPGRWYKYGRRQRRAIVAYTIFGTLATVILSVVIGAVAYGLQSRPSPTLGDFRSFEVRPRHTAESLCRFGHAHRSSEIA